MNCPQCGGQFHAVKVKSITVERCRDCGGTWYGKDELRVIKDREAQGDYRWIDVDLWRDIDKFTTGEQHGFDCPVDGKSLATVHYGGSGVRADICTACHGLFLKRGAYRKILDSLEQQVGTETLSAYLHDLKDEFTEIVTGPEGFFSEVADFAKVLHLLELRVYLDHSRLGDVLRSAGRGVPGA